MSSRKGSGLKPVLAKPTSGKLSGSKLSASRLNMNASLMHPRSSSASRNICVDFNSTLRSYVPPSTVTASVVPSVDYELECDFAYNEYLQALMTQELVKEEISSHRLLMNDQLSINSNLLLEKREEVNKLEKEIDKFELKPRLQELMNVVDTTLSRTLEVLTPAEERLDNVIQTLEQAKNYLYLKNVKLFETEDEACSFVELLDLCHKAVTKIFNISPHLEKCEELVAALKSFKRVEEEYICLEKSTAQLQARTQNLTLELASDVIFSLQAN